MNWGKKLIPESVKSSLRDLAVDTVTSFIVTHAPWLSWAGWFIKAVIRHFVTKLTDQGIAKLNLYFIEDKNEDTAQKLSEALRKRKEVGDETPDDELDKIDEQIKSAADDFLKLGRTRL